MIDGEWRNSPIECAEDSTRRMALQLTYRQRRWLDALIILGTIATAFVVVGFVGTLFFSFGDIVLVFFLAWLLAFILSPIVSALVRKIPRLPRVAAVVLVYAVLLGTLVVLAVLVANAIASSITDFIRSVPLLRDQLPALLAPWQERLGALGLGQVNLVAQATAFLDNIAGYANELVGPLQQLAVASLGILGNLLVVLILSLYMVADHDRILSFLFRLVPPAYAKEARLLESSIGSSFGGFLRGQAVMGIAYGLFAAAVSGVLGLDYLPVRVTANENRDAVTFELLDLTLDQRRKLIAFLYCEPGQWDHGRRPPGELRATGEYLRAALRMYPLAESH